MSRRSDQKELIDALSLYAHKLTRDENDMYSILLKRQRDDEDFDNISFEKLKKLHDKYVVKKNIEDIKKKYGF
jgi:hypothetical protein